MLAPYTSFRIGGPAKYFYVARTPGQLIAAYSHGVSDGIPVFVLGGGSNILMADPGFDGLVIKDECRECSADGASITSQSGVLLNRLVDVATDGALSGLEFAAGIPGTVGGAVFGNAGAFGGSIADVLESAVLYNPRDGTKIVDREYFDFGYRSSRLKKHPELVLSVTFRLALGQMAHIADKVNKNRELRRQKHPTREGSAGSVFKNIKTPQLLPAGELLEKAGVRGMKVGEAEIFERHCNIIVNKGHAQASDVRTLAELMQRKVLEKFNILLDYEMIFVNS